MFIPLSLRKEKTREHWKANRPRMYRELLKAGKLEEALDRAVEAYNEAESDLIAEGMDPMEVGSLLLTDFLFLPAEEDMPNLGENPEIRDPRLETLK